MVVGPKGEEIFTDGEGRVRKRGVDVDGDGLPERWEFPARDRQPARVGWDDDGDYEVDRWETGAASGSLLHTPQR